MDSSTLKARLRGLYAQAAQLRRELYDLIDEAEADEVNAKFAEAARQDAAER